MRQFAVCAIIALAVTAGSTANSAFSAPSDVLSRACPDSPSVVPGIRIGAVSLGNSFVDSVARLGAPAAMGNNPNRDATSDDSGWRVITRPEDGSHGRAWAQYGTGMQHFGIRATDDVVDQVQTLAVQCSDASGVTLGTSWSEVVSKYGAGYSTHQASASTSAVYNLLGVQFLVAPTTSAGGSIVGFGVFSPGRYCEIVGRTVCAKYTPPLR